MSSFAYFVPLSISYLVVWCTSKSPPNIIFFLADDLGYDDVGFQSHQIQTPAIDKYRNEGQFLEWYYAQTVCSPSRSALMTGMYPLHTGMNDVVTPNDAYGLPLEFATLPQILRKYANYSTHIVGKWHLGFYQWAYTPTFRGFDTFLGYYAGAEDYYVHKNGGIYDFHYANQSKCGANCSRPYTEGYNIYSTYIFTEHAINLIRNHSENNREQPLFLYLAYQAVHNPDECPAQYVNAYNESIQDDERRLFAGMLSCMDEGIANITDVLQSLGYLGDDGNTLVIFSSDNGGPVPENTGGATGTSNWPLRGGKDTVWEGGTRVTGTIWGTPDIVDYSKIVRGSNYTQLMHIVDFLPTLASAAGIDLKHVQEINYTLDGVDHYQGIIGNVSSTDNHNLFRDSLYYGLCTVPKLKYDALQYKGYKLVNQSGGNPDQWFAPPGHEGIAHYNVFEFDQIPWSGDGDGETNISDFKLYDLLRDPTEHVDISSNNTELVKQLYEMLVDLENTGVPQNGNDPNCPNQTYLHLGPPYGNAYVPWCDGYP